MKRLGLAVATAAALATLAGCSDGHSNNSVTTPPVQPPTTTSFTAFVHTQLAATSDTTQPADVNGVTFDFPDDNNPAAFNDVVGGP